MIAGGLRRLQREQVALEAQRARARDEGQRIGQREQDQVVLLVGLLQERAPVVDVHADARVLIRVVGVVLRTEALQRRVDLDRVDVRRTLRQRDRDIGARPRSDDQHPSGLALDHVVRLEVVGLLGHAGGHRRQPLVRDAVHRHRPRGAAATVVAAGRRDLVVRRPEVTLVVAQRVEEQHGQRDCERHRHADRLASQQHDEDHGDDAEPHQRRRADHRQQRERDDAGQAAEQVEAVGLEARQLAEAAAHDLGRPGGDRGDRQEDAGQHDPDRRTGRADVGEEHQLRRLAVDGDRIGAHEADQTEQHDQRVVRLRPVGQVVTRRAQEPETDAEERTQEDEVREVREVYEVRAEPADQAQLDEQHERARQNEPDAISHDR